MLFDKRRPSLKDKHLADAGYKLKGPKKPKIKKTKKIKKIKTPTVKGRTKVKVKVITQ